jgi:CheY-like chemotaxis protein
MIEKTGLPDIFPFHSLLTLLEGSGFRFGVDTRVRLGEYWQFVAKDEQLGRTDLKTHLGALLCRSVEELERFERVFDNYAPPGLKPIGTREIEPSLPQSAPAPIEKKPTETTTGQPDEGPKPPPPPPPPPSKSTERLGAVLPMLTFPEEPFRIWNLRGMSESLMLLQEKVLTETTEWDVPGTIGAIIRAGGYPKLAYRRRRQAPRYLVLIEQQSPRDHLAGYAAELVKEINHRDLEVAYYFFDKNPSRCWKIWRDPLTHVNLELLKSEWNGARLLLLSHASCFINPATGTPSNLALDLPDHFSNVALLATNSPLEWGAAERSLQTLVPVLPMSVEGLGHLMAAWNGEAQLGFGDWQMMLPEPVPPLLSGAAAQRAPAEVFMDVYRYLGKDAFRWLCACAVYPEIYFELTSILHDEAIPPLADLSEWEQHEQWNQAMRLLSRLYWFRRGYLPSTMLDDLKRNLKPADLALVEGEIRRILEISKNRVDDSTHAAGIRQRMFDWMAEQGFRVLWIDDNPENNRQLIDSWSKSLGVLFRQATSTAEAASLLETERFELVISDIGRKDEEKPADATIRMVNRQSPAPPVVFFTDNRGMRLRGTLMEAGAYQVTDDIGELQQALSAVWDRKFKPVEVVPPQEQVQEQTAGSMPPESSYQQNVNEPPPLNQTAQDQEMLKKLGFYEGEIDGTPGEQFRSAISRFQRANKLVADGIMGPQTREMLKKVVAEFEAHQTIPEEWRQRARSVCRITLPDGKSGIGFYMKDGFVYTSKAVLRNAEDARIAKAQFYYVQGNAVNTFEFDPSDYQAGSDISDFARVRLKATASLFASYSPPALPLSSKGPGTGDKVSVIYFPPSGELTPKLALEAPLFEFSADNFGYEATTENSAVGAPAFNAHGEVVGITLSEEGKVKRGRLMRSINIPSASNLSLNEIRNLIAEDNIEQGLNELRRMFPDNNEIALQIGRWEALERDYLSGKFEKQEYYIESSKIRQVALFILDNLEKNQPNYLGNEPKRSRFLLTSGQKAQIMELAQVQFSPFSRALIETLDKSTEPEISIEQLADRVTYQVSRFSSVDKKPELSTFAGHDGGEFLFKRKEAKTNRPLTKGGDSQSLNYIMAFGVSQYQDFQPLRAAVTNVNEFQNMLSENYDFNRAQIATFLDEEATKMAILDVLGRNIVGLTERDNLVIYFSGYSYSDKNTNQVYWVPFDGKSNEFKSFISQDDINLILQKCSALNILIIEDAFNLVGDKTRTSYAA